MCFQSQLYRHYLCFYIQRNAVRKAVNLQRKNTCFVRSAKLQVYSTYNCTSGITQKFTTPLMSLHRFHCDFFTELSGCDACFSFFAVSKRFLISANAFSTPLANRWESWKPKICNQRSALRQSDTQPMHKKRPFLFHFQTSKSGLRYRGCLIYGYNTKKEKIRKSKKL